MHGLECGSMDSSQTAGAAARRRGLFSSKAMQNSAASSFLTLQKFSVAAVLSGNAIGTRELLNAGVSALATTTEEVRIFSTKLLVECFALQPLLHVAARTPNNSAIVSLLIDFKASVDAPDKD